MKDKAENKAPEERRRAGAAEGKSPEARSRAGAAAAAAAGILLCLLLWLQERRSEGLLMLLLGAAAAGALLYLPVQRRREARQKRENALREEYPGLVQRITLYMAAGLSLRSALERMTTEYAEARRQGGKRREAMEELLITRREMLGGVYEDQAYGSFGRRCGTPEYLRLGGLLETYFQQGNRELLTVLKASADSAMTLALERVRGKSSGVSAKLLIPIMLLFALTLMMIIVPAFMQMQAAV